jgi:protoporphyrinogen/coproporphyrinogen III oxidase
MNVAVVGGGLAGLAAAYRLTGAGAHVTVFEAGARWGGQVHTERAGRFVVEQGAEGYAAARTSGRELCTSLGLAGRLVSQLTSKTFILRDGAMVPAPLQEAAELVGIQTDRRDYGHGLTSLRGGMGQLTDALLAALEASAELRLATPVTGLALAARGWTLTTVAGEALAVDAVVLATAAAAAARLLEPVSSEAAGVLGSLETLSSVSVSLACRRRSVAHALDASGFVLPGGVDGVGLRACTFVSSKFPVRAPRGRVLLRAFFRPGPALPIDAPDQRWVELAVESLWPALGVTGDPLRTWVARWPDAIARYAPDHTERMTQTRSVLEAAAPALELAGAAYCSAGVAGAIESAEDAVGRLLALSRTPAQRYGSGGGDVS